MVRVIVISVMLGLFQGSAQAAEVVLSVTNDEGRKDYAIDFLGPQFETTHRIDLGRLKGQPTGVWSKDGTQFFYSLPSANNKHWQLVGYKPSDRSEFVRIDIGRRSYSNPEVGAFWSELSNDGKHLFVLTLERKKWHIETYETASYTRIARVPIDKGQVAISQLAGNRLLAVMFDRRNANDRLYFIDPVAGSVLLDTDLVLSENSIFLASKDKSHVYIRTNKFKRYRDAENRNMRRKGAQGKIRIIDVLKGRFTFDETIGWDVTPPYTTRDDSAVYVTAKTHPQEPEGTIWRISGGDITPYRRFKSKCRPTATLVDEKRSRATVLCRKMALHFEGNEGYAFQVGMQGGQGFYAERSDSIFLLERQGSKIGKVALTPPRYVGDHASGRTGIKVVEGIGTVLNAAVAGYYGYPGIMPVAVASFRHTSLMPDLAERRLYISNLGTRDVTVVDADSFKKLAVHPTGEATLRRFHQSPYVFSLTPSMVTVFDATADEPALTLKKGDFLGLNGVADRLYWSSDDGGLEMYKLSTLERVGERADLQGSYVVLAPGDDPDHAWP